MKNLLCLASILSVLLSGCGGGSEGSSPISEQGPKGGDITKTDTEKSINICRLGILTDIAVADIEEAHSDDPLTQKLIDRADACKDSDCRIGVLIDIGVADINDRHPNDPLTKKLIDRAIACK